MSKSKVGLQECGVKTKFGKGVKYKKIIKNADIGLDTIVLMIVHMSTDPLDVFYVQLRGYGWKRLTCKISGNCQY